LSAAEDASFLERMFVEAALWRPEWPRADLEVLIQQPMLARYFRDWGRTGDLALLALEGELRVGAAWYRVFPAGEPGYGHVAPDIPELGIAIERDWRGRGIGRLLLHDLQAAASERGFPGLSLSVHAENPAIRLYERAGFEHAARSETAITMRWTAAP
jgi:ribosomal protein S18 acetylase RimI-like enzyme